MNAVVISQAGTAAIRLLSCSKDMVNQMLHRETEQKGYSRELRTNSPAVV